MKKVFLLLAALFLLLTACTTVWQESRPDQLESGSQRGYSNIIHSLENNTFDPTTITIKKGSRITFADISQMGSLHVLVIGLDGQNEMLNGAPSFGGYEGAQLDRGETWISPPWNTAGTYHVTCTVHPRMNLTVVVTS